MRTYRRESRNISLKLLTVFLSIVFLTSCAGLSKDQLNGIIPPKNPNPNITIEDVFEADHILDDVTEIIGEENVRAKLLEYEALLKTDNSVLNQIKLGIVYHEASLNLLKLGEKGYAVKSYTLLGDPKLLASAPPNMMPIIVSYLASARSLMGAEEGSIKHVKDAFLILDRAEEQFGEVSSTPLFLRGSIAENLPWIFFKGGVAKTDFKTIIKRDKLNDKYASDKIMSFVYFGLAKQVLSDSDAAKGYLHTSMQLDPDKQAAYEMADNLLATLK